MNCGGKQAFRYKINDNSQRKLGRKEKKLARKKIAALVSTG